MAFVWITIQEEIEGGDTIRTHRVLINTDQICLLSGRDLSMSDAEHYRLSLVSANNLISFLYDPSTGFKEGGS